MSTENPSNNSPQPGQSGGSNVSPAYDNLPMAVVGGIAIASAITLNLMFTGRLTKFSEMFYTVIRHREYKNWKLATMLGLIISCSYYYLFVDQAAFNDVSQFLGKLSLIGYGLFGVLVGFGAQLAGGCTSIFFCGLPKKGKRFILEATIIILSAMAVANVKQNVKMPDWITTPSFTTLADELNLELKNFLVFGGSSGFAVCYVIFLMFKNRKSELKEFFISVVTGFIYGIGLILSGMVKPSKVLGFLSFNSVQESELVVTFTVVVGMNFLTFFWLYDINNFGKYPLETQETSRINLRNILGCIIFGIGWGTAGICPSVAIMTCFLYIPHMALFLACVFIGQEMALKVDENL